MLWHEVAETSSSLKPEEFFFRSEKGLLSWLAPIHLYPFVWLPDFVQR